MPDTLNEVLTLVPKVADIVEKAGIIGILLVVCGVLGWALWKRTAELSAVYRQRDKWRLAFVQAKSILVAEKLDSRLNLSDMEDLLGKETT